MTRVRFASIALASLLLACGSVPPAADSVAPNANLVVQGIPPIPRSVAEQVAKYTDIDGHGFVDWHPTQREMLVSHRPAGGDTVQLFRVRAPLAEPEALTAFADPVRRASYEPIDGRYIVFARGSGGDEADQLYRLDLPDKQVTLLTDARERHAMQGWLHGGRGLLVMSVPLDRTAPGGTRSIVSQTLSLVDPMNPAGRRSLAELPGGGWSASTVSWDDRRIALTRYLSAGESQVWLLEIATGARTQLLPAAGSTERFRFASPDFKRDGSGLYLATDRAGEFRELAFYDFATRHFTPITRQVPGDVDGGSADEAGALIAARANVDGRGELRLFDAHSFKELPAPKVPGGSVGATVFHPKLPELAFSINSTRGPSQVHTLNPVSGAVEPWTRPHASPDVDMASFGDQRIVRWKSFDGLAISGILTAPPARFKGRRPVLINIHGGPESQAGLGFMGRYNFLLDELGIAVIQPNVRGSSGFGKTFLALDNGFKREDPVRDIGALLDWIATQPDLDASRVVVMGGSYGGYMSLAVATHYADRIAGAIDVVGISNFLTFLRNTESYRRDLRRVEYGDERDPAMRDFLETISPLTNARRITRPLFVVQGRNDPRVPWTEAEQMVAKARENGTPVWYLRAENEGHGFARKENADFQFYAMVMFLRETLLK